jgi:hypothetical protein
MDYFHILGFLPVYIWKIKEMKCFRGMYCLHLQDRRGSQATINMQRNNSLLLAWLTLNPVDRGNTLF